MCRRFSTAISESSGTTWQGMPGASRSWEQPRLMVGKEMRSSVLQRKDLNLANMNEVEVSAPATWHRPEPRSQPSHTRPLTSRTLTRQIALGHRVCGNLLHSNNSKAMSLQGISIAGGTGHYCPHPEVFFFKMGIEICGHYGLCRFRMSLTISSIHKNI